MIYALREIGGCLLKQVRAWQSLLRWLLAAIFVGLTSAFLLRNLDQLSFVLDLDWRLLLLALVNLIAYLAVQAWWLLVIMKRNGLRGIGFLKWLQILILSRFLNKWVPQAGTAYRGVRLKTAYGFTYTEYASSFASSAWLSVVLDLLLTLGLTMLLQPTLRIGPWAATPSIGFFLLLVVAAPIALHRLLLRVRCSGGVLAHAHNVLWQIVDALVEGIEDLRFLGQVSLLGVLAFAVKVLEFHLLLMAFGISAGVPTVALFVCLLSLSTIVNVTPGNLGVQELAYGFLGSAVGIGAAQGIVVSGVSRVLSYALHTALAATFGTVALLRPKKAQEG